MYCVSFLCAQFGHPWRASLQAHPQLQPNVNHLCLPASSCTLIFACLYSPALPPHPQVRHTYKYKAMRAAFCSLPHVKDGAGQVSSKVGHDACVEATQACLL